VAIEVKATAAPNRDDGRHLVWLREALGDRADRIPVWVGPYRG
jgi:hypothetical protein